MDIQSIYSMQLANKSDQEIKLRALELAKRALELQSSTSPSVRAQASLALEEANACQEELKRRQDIREREKSASEKWTQSLPKRQYAAVRNLKEAVTPNGQLVAAILEDEGSLTEAEIAAWCDELAALDSSALYELLTALVQEGILSFQEGKYTLLEICTEDLFPENPAEWAICRMENEWMDEDAEKAILYLIAKKGRAISQQEIASASDDSYFASIIKKLGYSHSSALEKLRDIREYLHNNERLSMSLEDMVACRVLRVTVIDGFHLFYFPMVGERGTGR